MSEAEQNRVGSSPLTRGKQAHDLDALGQVRLIPAHAGKTAPAHATHTRKPAHPRSRGENVHAVREVDRVSWLIPAHAGKTGRLIF